jgi:methylenetetrahydrofolate dehydrogenase (NADP+)/methenyltetrahydrofolate cyclohydrolase
MTAKIIDGAALAQRLRAEFAARAQALAAQGHRPGLTVVIAGDNPASRVYVRNKIKACSEAAFDSRHVEFPESVTTATLLHEIERLNGDPEVHGILVQLPLPRQVDAARVTAAIAPHKDVDGFHVANLGGLVTGHADFAPCTPAGVMEMLRSENIPIEGKHAVVIGRSNIVGKPMALLLLQAGATVTICHSKTADLPSVTRQADILVAAVGKAHFVRADMVKPGACVIDVGINRQQNGKLAGDVEFETVRKVAGWITPVPGGVGPMTIAMLLSNTLKATERSLAARRDSQALR